MDDCVRLWEVDFVRRPRKDNRPREKTCLWMHDEDCVGECWERIREEADWDLNADIRGPNGGTYRLDGRMSTVMDGVKGASSTGDYLPDTPGNVGSVAGRSWSVTESTW